MLNPNSYAIITEPLLGTSEPSETLFGTLEPVGTFTLNLHSETRGTFETCTWNFGTSWILYLEPVLGTLEPRNLPEPLLGTSEPRGTVWDDCPRVPQGLVWLRPQSFQLLGKKQQHSIIPFLSLSFSLCHSIIVMTSCAAAARWSRARARRSLGSYWATGCYLVTSFFKEKNQTPLVFGPRNEKMLKHGFCKSTAFSACSKLKSALTMLQLLDLNGWASWHHILCCRALGQIQGLWANLVWHLLSHWGFMKTQFVWLVSRILAYVGNFDTHERMQCLLGVSFTFSDVLLFQHLQPTKTLGISTPFTSPWHCGSKVQK